MSRKNLIAVLAFVAVVLIGATSLLLWKPIILPVIEVAGLFHAMDVQMSAGRHYMDSLKSEDIRSWIERSKQLKDAAPPGSYAIGTYGGGSNTPIPEDLKKLKILRIDIFNDTVSYVWCGGMDHCELIVEKLSDGTYQVTAQYDDAHRRILWPNS